MLKSNAASLQESILSLHGVGPASAGDLRQLGIARIGDLLEHLPVRHEPYAAPIALRAARENEIVTVRGMLTSLATRRSFRRRLTIQEGLLNDGKSTLSVVWFNQPYLAQLAKNQPLVLRGKMQRYRSRLTLVSPEIIKDPDLLAGQEKLMPIYPLAGRLTVRQMRYWIKQALPLLDKRREILPREVIRRHKLLDRSWALAQLHFPTDPDQLAAARKRMTFEELLLLSLFVLRERQTLQSFSAEPITINTTLLQKFVAQLPFTLTKAQRVASWQILQDMAKPRPMNRLLEGDVGSGKTVVAAMALLATARANRQAVLLAPTVVLAQQHAYNLRKLLAPLGIGVSLFAGSFIENGSGQPRTRTQLKAALASGSLKVLVATHGVLRPEITFKNLSLFVVDEQHRFGVKQRQLLKSKVHKNNYLPHLLSMTATPIPRSLALTVYGDLDLSILDEKPLGRPKIQTNIVRENELSQVYTHIQDAVANGGQAFVMYPLIDESETLAAHAVTADFTNLKKQLRGLRVGMLHGRMKDEEKNNVMLNFKSGKLDVLAATPVIEVGIDVPRATAMLIRSADRFGLAQLHQFRGRIGRSERASTCFLCPDAATPATRRRLQLLAESQDGFSLAEADLEMRGPGEIFGTKQHGQVTFKYATVLDSRVLAAAKAEAAHLIAQDPDLKSWPILQKHVLKVGSQLHLE